jgi:PEP-CTERM motif
VGTNYDRLNVNGSVTLGGIASFLTGTVGYTPGAGDLLFILANDGAEPVTGTFTSLPNFAVFNLGGFDWQISYGADLLGNTFTGGNDIALLAVPEPSALLLSGLSAVALLRRRRHR